MRLQSFSLAAFAALCALPAHAIYINRDAFTANGGDLQDIAGTAANVFDKLRTASFATQFDPVGDLGGCAGTWLGTEGHFAWILTAAHCVPSVTLSRPVGHLTFRNAQDVPLAGGAGGWAFHHPNRFNRPHGVSEAGTDIALLKLPLLPAAFSSTLPTGAIVNDRMDEVGQKISMVGHGSVGVGQVSVDNAWPTQGARRAWGESQVDKTIDNGYTAVADYSQNNGTTHWARAGLGDGGVAWWQRRGGLWSVVATTSGGTASWTTGTRVAHYAAWIKQLYPAVRLQSESMRVTEAGAYLSPNLALEAGNSSVYYVVAPGQPGVTGPASGIWSGHPLHSRVSVPVENPVTGARDTVHLRGRKSAHCRWVQMNDAVNCNVAPRIGPFHLEYLASENTHLPSGQWRSKVDIDAIAWKTSYRQRLTVDIDIVQGERARVTNTTPFQSANYGLNSVYFTIPQQSGASGPSTRYWANSGSDSTITVNARNAITQAIVPVRLRAARHHGCFWRPMNNAVSCHYMPITKLQVRFDPHDNVTLPPGIYRGQFTIDVGRWNDGGYRKAILVDLDIDTLLGR